MTMRVLGSDQPMKIDLRYARTFPPEGMTCRELWQARFAGWVKIEEQNYTRGAFHSTFQSTLPHGERAMTRLFTRDTIPLSTRPQPRLITNV